MAYDWISLTTDYGVDDGFVAACKGVIGRIAPNARTIDVTHNIPPQDVRRGAAAMAQTVPYLPAAVHFAVVDPGVGTARRGIAVVAENGVLVGPDNGLLVSPAEALGGIRAAYELASAEHFLPVVSATFHGRDIFAPVSAHLANGVDPAELGPAVDLDDLVRLPAPRTSLTNGSLDTEVLSVDRFGNVQLAATAADLGAAGLVPVTRVRLRLDTHSVEATLGTTFADVPQGALLAFADSAGFAAVAVNGGSAAGRLNIAPGARLVLESI